MVNFDQQFHGVIELQLVRGRTTVASTSVKVARAKMNQQRSVDGCLFSFEPGGSLACVTAPTPARALTFCAVTPCSSAGRCAALSAVPVYIVSELEPPSPPPPNLRRSRRFRAAQERDETVAKAEELRQEMAARGLAVPPPPEDPPFDSNVITPGTEFMFRLAEFLRFCIADRVNHNPAWKNIKV